MQTTRLSDLNPSSPRGRALARSRFVVPYRNDISRKEVLEVRRIEGEGERWMDLFPMAFEKAAYFLGKTVRDIPTSDGQRIHLAAVNPLGQVHGRITMQLPPVLNPDFRMIKRVNTACFNDPNSGNYKPDISLKGVGSILCASAAQLLLKHVSSITPDLVMDAHTDPYGSGRYVSGFFLNIGMKPYSDQPGFFRFVGDELLDFLERMYVKYPEPSKPYTCN